MKNQQKAGNGRMKTMRKIAIWTIIGLGAVVVILIAGLFFFSGSIVGAAPAPLQLLPLSSATPGAASPDGTWTAGNGSIAGFRVPESFLVQSGTIVGRTSAVTGSLVIAHNEISSGSFQVDLTRLSVVVEGKQNTSIFQILGTNRYPEATLTLTQPIMFASLPTGGQTISSHAAVAFALHGVTRTVTFTLTGRYNGSVLEALGSAPVLVSTWGIQSPSGIHKNAVVEFLVVLHRG
jgi:hypothetical protein